MIGFWDGEKICLGFLQLTFVVFGATLFRLKKGKKKLTDFLDREDFDFHERGKNVKLLSSQKQKSMYCRILSGTNAPWYLLWKPSSALCVVRTLYFPDTSTPS